MESKENPPGRTIVVMRVPIGALDPGFTSVGLRALPANIEKRRGWDSNPRDDRHCPRDLIAPFG